MINAVFEEALWRQARHRAFSLLAKREYSRAQLSAKLEGFDALLVEQLLSEFEAQGYLSDTRFAYAFLRTSIAMGRGPIRIAFELKTKGIAASLIEQVLKYPDEDELACVDWCELARQTYARKFGAREEAIKLTPKEKQARQRFMQYRGFEYAHYQELLR